MHVELFILAGSSLLPVKHVQFVVRLEFGMIHVPRLLFSASVRVGREGTFKQRQEQHPRLILGKGGAEYLVR